MTDILLHKCEFYNQQNKRKYDIKRHQNAKHKCQNIENTSEKITEKNVSPNRKNVSPNRKNVSPNQNICKKCNKIYMTKNSLIEHEKNCKGIDELTCPRCIDNFYKQI